MFSSVSMIQSDYLLFQLFFCRQLERVFSVIAQQCCPNRADNKSRYVDWSPSNCTYGRLLCWQIIVLTNDMRCNLVTGEVWLTVNKCHCCLLLRMMHGRSTIRVFLWPNNCRGATTGKPLNYIWYVFIWMIFYYFSLSWGSLSPKYCVEL